MFVDSRLRPGSQAPSSHSWSTMSPRRRYQLQRKLNHLKTWCQLKPTALKSSEPVGAAPPCLSSSRARARVGSSCSSHSSLGARNPCTSISFAARAGQVQELEQPPVQASTPDPHKGQTWLSSPHLWNWNHHGKPLCPAARSIISLSSRAKPPAEHQHLLWSCPGLSTSCDPALVPD